MKHACGLCFALGALFCAAWVATVIKPAHKTREVCKQICALDPLDAGQSLHEIRERGFVPCHIDDDLLDKFFTTAPVTIYRWCDPYCGRKDTREVAVRFAKMINQGKCVDEQSPDHPCQMAFQELMQHAGLVTRAAHDKGWLQAYYLGNGTHIVRFPGDRTEDTLADVLWIYSCTARHTAARGLASKRILWEARRILEETGEIEAHDFAFPSDFWGRPK